MNGEPIAEVVGSPSSSMLTVPTTVDQFPMPTRTSRESITLCLQDLVKDYWSLLGFIHLLYNKIQNKSQRLNYIW
jgi:hypothetical protein